MHQYDTLVWMTLRILFYDPPMRSDKVKCVSDELISDKERLMSPYSVGYWRQTDRGGGHQPKQFRKADIFIFKLQTCSFVNSDLTLIKI